MTRWGSCFDEEEYRPENAAVLAESLEAILGPLVVEVEKKVPSGLIRSEQAKSHDTPRETVNSIGMKSKRIPAGQFEMVLPDSDKDELDEERPRDPVQITRPFYLGIHQVTLGQFGVFVESTRYQTEAERGKKVLGPGSIDE